MLSIFQLFEIQPNMQKVSKAYLDKIKTLPKSIKRDKLSKGWMLALRRQNKRPSRKLLNLDNSMY
jgi:glycine cleavage system H lipoate-binding protein